MNISLFNSLKLEHKEILNRYFRMDPPQCSELTFTNLFMWRHKNNPQWLEYEDCLLLIFMPEKAAPYGLEPVGIGDKKHGLEMLFNILDDLADDPEVHRASEGFAKAFVDESLYEITLDRDNCDYVYSTKDLIDLSGRKYHRKKNHVNRFLKEHEFVYRDLDSDFIGEILELQETWCMMKECVYDPSLMEEDYAIHEALVHFEALDYSGGAIQIGSHIEAFSLGEMLDDKTAVIHIEKANPEIPGLYTVINRLFADKAWASTEFINREQDLGIEGLRKAKESYYPHHMVNKYTIARKL